MKTSKSKISHFPAAHPSIHVNNVPPKPHSSAPSLLRGLSASTSTPFSSTPRSQMEMIICCEISVAQSCGSLGRGVGGGEKQESPGLSCPRKAALSCLAEMSGVWCIPTLLRKKPGECEVRLALVLTPHSYILPDASQQFALHHHSPT